MSPGDEVKGRSPWWRWTTMRQQMFRPARAKELLDAAIDQSEFERLKAKALA